MSRCNYESQCTIKGYNLVDTAACRQCIRHVPTSNIVEYYAKQLAIDDQDPPMFLQDFTKPKM